MPARVGGRSNVSACSLQNVSFSLSPGKVTALVGPSGSGKSSCVNVLENFYPLDGGRVLLDGRPVGAYDHKFLHRVVRGRLRPLLALPCLSFALAGCDRRRRAPQRVATGAAPPRSRGRAFQRPSSLPRGPPGSSSSSPDFHGHRSLLLFLRFTVSVRLPTQQSCVSASF